MMFRATLIYLGKTGSGMHRLKIKASNVFGGRVTEVELDQRDMDRVDLWLKSGKNIQTIFPDWSASRRELFMTGMNDEDWDRATA